MTRAFLCQVLNTLCSLLKTNEAMADQPTAEFLKQYDALHGGVGLAHLENWTLIELTGGDRASFLHNFCTNDIKGLKPGDGCEAFITNVQGKILGHVFVFCNESALELLTVPEQADALVTHLDRYLIREDVEIHDRTSERSNLILAGAGSAALLGVHGIKVSDEAMTQVTGKLNGIQIVVRRIPWTGPECFVLTCNASERSALTASLLETSDTNRRTVECGLNVVETCRIESGMPKYAIDMTEANLPQEVNRNEQAISFTKGCYLGQETVARIDALGHVNRLLVGVKTESLTIPESGTELKVGEKVVGKITSTTYSPALQSNFSLALVRREHSTPGTQLTLESGCAEVCSLPVS